MCDFVRHDTGKFRLVVSVENHNPCSRKESPPGAQTGVDVVRVDDFNDEGNFRI